MFHSLRMMGLFLCLVGFAMIPARAGAEPAVVSAGALESLFDVEDLALLDVRPVGSKVPDIAKPQPEKPESPEKAEKPWLMGISFTLASDYRSAGISLTNGKPAVQAEVSVEHHSGLFASVWASTISDDNGGSVEIDVTAGYSFELGAVEPSIGATAYFYPGIADSSYLELFTEVAIPAGDATFTLGAAYTPKQAHVDGDNLYLGAAAEWAIADTPVTLEAAFGRENGACADKKLDWEVAANYRLNDHFSARVAYADSHRAFSPHSGPAAIFSVTASF